jgi:pyridinium-3,5-bisthiocarboxylic acid mononucleotide nickel chelatase
MEWHMKTLYLDCFSGISGNMFIGMLVHAGVPFEEMRLMMEGLHLDGYSLVCKTVSKLGIQAVYYNVLLTNEQEHDEIKHNAHEHHHHHKDNQMILDAVGHHHHHEHRGLAEITKIIQDSALTDTIKEKSLAVFSVLAAAEAKVHGVPVEEIHFHEVGAVDCILDIVGTVWALDYLGIEQIGVSPLHAGSGFVQCAHGIMPIPAPASAELLTGIPYYSTDVCGELVTPTGAALVKTLAAYIGPRPKSFVHSCTAYGAGTKNLSIPNVVRGFIGQAKKF